MRISLKRKSVFVLLIALFALAMLLSFTACSGGDDSDELIAPPVEIAMDITSKTIMPGDEFAITASASDSSSLSWRTSNSKIATVENGVVLGKGQGEAVITAFTGSIFKNCYVTVLEDNRTALLSVDNVEASNTLSLGHNEEYDLQVVISYDGKSVDGALSFDSSDPTVATVSDKGVITTLAKNGQTVITVSGVYREFDASTLRAEITLTVSGDKWTVVRNSYDKLYALSEFESKSYLNKVAFDAKLTVGDATVNSGFIVTSEDTSIATVEGNEIVAKGQGETWINFSYTDTPSGKVYERKEFIAVDYISVDRTQTSPEFLRRNAPSLNQFSVYAEGENVREVYDVTQADAKLVKPTSKTYENLGVGSCIVEIYSNTFKITQSLFVIDYNVTTAEQFKQYLPEIANDKESYIEIEADIADVGTITRGDKFVGTIDGKGHTVSGMVVPSDSALFGTASGTIKNLALTNVTLNPLSAPLCSMIGSKGLLVDNCYISFASVTAENERKACGGLFIQIGGGGNPTISNTIVVMPSGVANQNIGAVAGAWWGGLLTMTNSYFITDGTPYGNHFGSDGTSNGKGNTENTKGEWTYIYESATAFKTERDKPDTKINLDGFNTAIWDLTQDVPTFA